MCLPPPLNHNGPTEHYIRVIQALNHNHFWPGSEKGVRTDAALSVLACSLADDGASFFSDTDNFLVYGGTQNNGGTRLLFQGNVIVHPTALYIEGNSDTAHPCGCGLEGDSSVEFRNNTCIMLHPYNPSEKDAKLAQKLAQL